MSGTNWKIGKIGDITGLSRIEQPSLNEVLDGIEKFSWSGWITEGADRDFPVRHITDFMFKESLESIQEALTRLSEKGEKKSHSTIFVEHQEGIDMSLEELCRIMESNGFHVHATTQEAEKCDLQMEEDF